MNLDKSVLFPLKVCSSSEIENIPVKHKLTYVSVIICKNGKQRSQLIWNQLLRKLKINLICG